MAVHGAGSTNTNANADDNSARGPPSPSSGRRRSLNRLNPPRLRVAIDGATGAAAGAATPPPANGRSNIHTYRLAKALFDYFYAQPKEGGSDKEGRNQPSLASALSFEGAWWTYIDVRRLLPGCPSFLEAIHDHQCVLPLLRHSFIVLQLPCNAMHLLTFHCCFLAFLHFVQGAAPHAIIAGGRWQCFKSLHVVVLAGTAACGALFIRSIPLFQYPALASLLLH